MEKFFFENEDIHYAKLPLELGFEFIDALAKLREIIENDIKPLVEQILDIIKRSNPPDDIEAIRHYMETMVGYIVIRELGKNALDMVAFENFQAFVKRVQEEKED